MAAAGSRSRHVRHEGGLDLLVVARVAVLAEPVVGVDEVEQKHVGLWHERKPPGELARARLLVGVGEGADAALERHGPPAIAL